MGIRFGSAAGPTSSRRRAAKAGASFMGAPLVSIIVTTYNRPALLRETVASIARQTFTDWELVVVDNFSQYDVPSLLAEFKDKRMRLIQNHNEGLIAVNRNVGIRAAAGRFLAFCDDDDLWAPEKLAKQVAFFDGERYVAVGTSSTYFSGTTLFRRRARLAPGDRGLAEILTQGGVPLSSLFSENIGCLFSLEPKFMNAEDYEFQLALVARSGRRIALLADPLLRYRVHERNNFHEPALRLSGVRVVESFEGRVPEDVYRKALGRQYFLAGMSALRAGDASARAHFGRALDILGRSGQVLLGLVVARLPIRLWKWVLAAAYVTTQVGKFDDGRDL